MTTLPRDDNGQVIAVTPAIAALVVTKNDAVSNTSEVDITLNTSTTYIRVTTLDNGLFMKYGTTATSTDFDEYIPAGQTFDYVIPKSVTVISVIADAAAAKVRIIEK